MALKDLPKEDRPDIEPGWYHPDDQAAGNPTDPRSNDVASGNSSDPRGEGPDSLDGVRQSEKSGAGESGFYNDGGSSNSRGGDGEDFYNDDKPKKKRSRFIVTPRRAIVGVVVGALISLTGLLFTGINSLNLPSYLSNVEKKGFLRYQVDLRGRSSKWIETYMMLRFGEIEDPNVAPKDRNNILFRSNRVDNNKPLTDWYRTLRASKFEQEVFEKRGIKFVSIAYQDGNSIRFRPATVTFVNTDTRLTFDPSPKVFEAIEKNDINVFNGELRNFVQADVMSGDKEARAAISQLLKEERPGWWRAVQRWHLRKDIQNMIGVRDWRFFETTRQKLAENRIDRRNDMVQRFVNSALPEDSKSGKFIECLFGLANCTASTDVANPQNRALSADGTRKLDNKTANDGNPNTADPALGDNSGESNLKEGSNKAAEAGKGVRAALPKALRVGGIASLLDSLARFDDAVRNHKLSALVTQAKGQYALGVFTTIKIAGDQFRTGEMSSEDLKTFMTQYGNLTRGEGWSTVINGRSSSASVSAASDNGDDFTTSKNKKEFCSEKHQNEIEKPENKQAAEKEYQYLCPADRIGGPNNASNIEDAWNNGPGGVLHPILNVYKTALGGIFDVINSVTGAVQNAALSTLGLKDNVEDVVAWGATKAIEAGGANMNINNQTPSGRVGNIGIEGAAYGAESTMRYQGGAATTEASAALANHNVLAYERDEYQTMNLYQRYAAITNPESVFSKQLASIGYISFGSIASSLAKTLGSALISPLKVFTGIADAANSKPDGYAAARFAGIETFDLPKECLNSEPIDMTPQSSTNADELGIFSPAELTWELMENKTKWYDALYAKIGNDEAKAKKVWNCGLFDNAAKGGLGAKYGYKGADAFQGGAGQPQNSGDDAVIPSGDAQSLAKKIIDSKKISGDSRYMKQIIDIKDGKSTCNVNPTILAMLVGLANDGHKVYISSLNRKCTNVLTASGEGSYHWREGGGHAIDVTAFDNQPVDGGNAATLNYLNAASKYLPENTGYGQVSKCGSGFKVPKGSYEFSDSCDHQHIQVPVKKMDQ